MTESTLVTAGRIIPAQIVTEEMINSRSWARGQGPFYKMDETAKMFFAMSASWLRLKLRPDEEHPETWFVADGKRMDFRRKDPLKSDSARVFTLADIPPMVYSLYGFGAFDHNGGAIRVGQILRIVEATAVLYGLITPPDTTGSDLG